MAYKNKETALERINNPYTLNCKVFDNFRDDEDVVLYSVMGRWNSNLNGVAEKLKKKKSFVLKLVSENSLTLQAVSKKLRSDPEVVFEAIKENGCALEYAIGNFNDNKELVLMAIASNQWCYKYVSDRLKDDEDVVLLTCKKWDEKYRGSQNHQINEYLSEKWKAIVKDNDDPLGQVKKYLLMKELEKSLSKDKSTKIKPLKV